MNRAIIFDVDGTLAETEETHRKAFNRAFRGAGLDWSWDQALYRKLLAVTGGKERIRYFIEDFGGEGVPRGNLDDFIVALHAEKTRAYTRMAGSGELELRPDVYLRVLEELDLPAASCIAIEDSRNGLLSAHAARLATIVTPGIYTLGEDFDEATLVIDSLEALGQATLESLFSG